MMLSHVYLEVLPYLPIVWTHRALKNWRDDDRVLPLRPPLPACPAFDCICQVARCGSSTAKGGHTPWTLIACDQASDLMDAVMTKSHMGR